MKQAHRLSRTPFELIILLYARRRPIVCGPSPKGNTPSRPGCRTAHWRIPGVPSYRPSPPYPNATPDRLYEARGLPARDHNHKRAMRDRGGRRMRGGEDTRWEARHHGRDRRVSYHPKPTPTLRLYPDRCSPQSQGTPPRREITTASIWTPFRRCRHQFPCERKPLAICKDRIAPMPYR